jgi:hypothetical protein
MAIVDLKHRTIHFRHHCGVVGECIIVGTMSLLRSMHHDRNCCVLAGALAVTALMRSGVWALLQIQGGVDYTQRVLCPRSALNLPTF